MCARLYMRAATLPLRAPFEYAPGTFFVRCQPRDGLRLGFLLAHGYGSRLLEKEIQDDRVVVCVFREGPLVFAPAFWSSSLGRRTDKHEVNLPQGVPVFVAVAGDLSVLAIAFRIANLETILHDPC